MKKILVVFGTRPEAIKMCPLIKELKSRDSFDVKVCVSSQHREMLEQVLHIFKVKPDYDLSIMKEKQTLFYLTSSILLSIEKILMEEKPDIVLVHGDTTTTFTTALACYYLKIPVGHVEAGLRTYDIYNPFPEEFNRRAVGIVSEYDFSPTLIAKKNLEKEGKDSSKIWVTGNTVIDSFKTTIIENYIHPELEWARGSKLIFITAHRRENLGEPMHQMFRAIRKIVNEYNDIKVLYPVHLNPYVKEVANQELSGCERIHLCNPIDVIDCHNIMNNSYIIMTDSGGIQEEAPSLGKPVLVMRNTTERPEGIDAGTLRLVGTNETNIYNNLSDLLTNKMSYDRMSKAVNPYGDGKASSRIADVLEFGELKNEKEFA